MDVDNTDDEEVQEAAAYVPVNKTTYCFVL